MYYVIQSKTVENEDLNKYSLNAQEVHKLLAKFFNAKDANWRLNGNILYNMKHYMNFIQLTVKSDIEINEEVVKELGFEICDKYDIAKTLPTDKVTLTTFVYPCRRDGRKKMLIRSEKDRITWITNKLSNRGECRVTNVVEHGDTCVNIFHSNVEKGCTQVWGYTYTLDVEILDRNALLEIINRGIGAEKSYGFGLVEVNG